MSPTKRSPSTGLITLTEAADDLGLHYMTVYRYVRTGRLAATKVGRVWQVDPADLAGLGATPIQAKATTARAAYPDRLASRLLAADESGAWSLLQQAMASGMEPESLLLDVVGPSLAGIGDGWHAGSVTVAQEHQATATATRLVGRLGPRFAVSGPTRGHVVVGAAPGDHHGLPSAILRDLLRGRHLSVTDLGADVPVESWASATAAAAAGSPRLVSVGIGAASGGHDPLIALAITAIRQAAPGVPIVLGGSAIAGAYQARKLGADHHSASTRDALRLLDVASPSRAQPKAV